VIGVSVPICQVGPLKAMSVVIAKQTIHIDARTVPTARLHVVSTMDVGDIDKSFLARRIASRARYIVTRWKRTVRPAAAVLIHIELQTEKKRIAMEMMIDALVRTSCPMERAKMAIRWFIRIGETSIGCHVSKKRRCADLSYSLNLELLLGYCRYFQVRRLDFVNCKSLFVRIKARKIEVTKKKLLVIQVPSGNNEKGWVR